MSYGISFTSGSLIPSFCLSIKGRHDAPLLSLCSDGKKSDLALYVYEFLLFLSAPCGGRLLNLTVVLFMLPTAACECQKASSAHHRSLHLPGWHKRLLSAYSWWQSRIVSSWADCSPCRVILMQWLKLRILRYQRNRCIVQYCPQLTPTSFTYGRLSFVLSWAVLP